MATEYYNDNLFIAYPFVESSELDFSWVVDVQVIMSPASNYSLSNPLYLISYTGDGSTLTFDFETEDIDGNTLTFSIDVPDTSVDYEEFLDSQDHGDLYLTIGRVSKMDFSSSDTFSTDHIVYPTNIVNLFGKQLTKIHVANKYDTQYSNDTCSIDPVVTTEDYKIVTQNLTGKINIDGGRNLNTSLIVNGNTMYINASPQTGFGEDINCTPVRTLPDTYDDTVEPSCNDSLFFVNGKTANKESNSFSIKSNESIEILPSSTPNTIDITFKTGLVTGVPETGLDCES